MPRRSPPGSAAGQSAPALVSGAALTDLHDESPTKRAQVDPPELMEVGDDEL